MNKNEIGVNAGKVWQLLSNNEKWSYGLLKRKSGLKDKELGAALGWLSRAAIYRPTRPWPRWKPS